MSNTAEILKKARELIKDPENWTQKACARDKYGYEVEVDSKEAYCFCTIGAIAKVSGRSTDGDARNVLRDIIGGSRSIANFNDGHTHPQVLDVFDRAIALAERRPA